LCLLGIVVLQVLLAIFVYVYNQDIENAASKGWDRLWRGAQQSELNRQAIDQIQRTIECCGSNTFLDYGVSIPASCCPSDAQFCNQLTSYKIGCKLQIRNAVQNSASWIAYTSIAMAIIEVNN
jgi:CD63 antigen